MRRGKSSGGGPGGGGGGGGMLQQQQQQQQQQAAVDSKDKPVARGFVSGNLQVFLGLVCSVVALGILYMTLTNEQPATKAELAVADGLEAIEGAIRHRASAGSAKKTIGEQVQADHVILEKMDKLKQQNDKLRNQVKEMEREMLRNKGDLKNVDINNKKNKNKNNGGGGDGGDDGGNADELEHCRSKSKHLEEEIQKMSKRIVLEKFGKGPHYVEIKVEFPPSLAPPGTADTFVVEMAPLDFMPHTVHLFLEQVSQHLYDGCSFHRNAGHVVQGGTAPYFHTPPNQNNNRAFRLAQLESVSFQEYSPEFPHVKYTLGYAGRPGGPDFYVSTMDNTRSHGPGGQTHYAIASEADPCFAKVVEGFETVNRMAQMPVKPGGYRAMQENVGIVYAKYMPPSVGND